MIHTVTRGSSDSRKRFVKRLHENKIKPGDLIKIDKELLFFVIDVYESKYNFVKNDIKVRLITSGRIDRNSLIGKFPVEYSYEHVNVLCVHKYSSAIIEDGSIQLDYRDWEEYPPANISNNPS